MAVGGSVTVGNEDASVTADAGVIAGVALGAGGQFGMQEDGKFHIGFNAKIALGAGFELGFDIAIDPQAVVDFFNKLNPAKWARGLADFATGVMAKAGKFLRKSFDKINDNFVKPLANALSKAKETVFKGVKSAVDFVGQRFEDLTGFAKEAVGAVRDGFKKAGEGIKDAGKKVGKGFKKAGKKIKKFFR